MPLTAYFVSAGKELDVQQLLAWFAQRDQVPLPAQIESVPDVWRQEIRTAVECPCCFVIGAEVVREAISRGSGKAVRQACFRFSSPGHLAQCDFAQAGGSNATPENWIAFGSTKSALTRAVRELVCTGMQLGVFSQKSIRDMREWFFRTKLESHFIVTLDHRIPAWIDGLTRSYAVEYGALPDEVELTKEIVAVPGFDWRAAARRVQRNRHRDLLNLIREERLWLHKVAERIEALARRHQGQAVLDPSALKEKYASSVGLAESISHNYAPIAKMPASRIEVPATSVLALAALLLFVSDWNPNVAANHFARIAINAGHANEDLGNVMGLNPFHDYEAWNKLRRLQELGITSPADYDTKAELQHIEAELRAGFAK